MLHRLLLLFFFALASVSPALGQLTPEQTVQEMIRTTQQTRNLIIILNYIHWESAYTALTPLDRQRAAVKSPEELRQRCRRYIENPTAAVRRELENRVGGADGPFSAVVDGMSDALVASAEDFKRQALEANYTVGRARMNGMRAEVPVQVRSRGSTQENRIQLARFSDRWMIPSLNALDRQGVLKDAVTGNLLGRLQANLLQQ